LQLGKQSLYLTYRQLKNLADQMDFSLSPAVPSNIDLKLDDKSFFHALGFAEVQSLEFSTTEGADYTWDLNIPISQELDSKFDMVYDGGTLEHVFNLPVALSNICKMLKIEGRIIHDSPTSGYLDHGFTSLQPTLFYDFYSAQNFEVNNIQISKLRLDTVFTQVGEHSTYVPGMYDFEKTWAIDQHVYMTFCAATKREVFHQMKVPQQSIWLRASRV
jgi:hypothetical protein